MGRLTEVGGSDPIGVPWWPLHQLDPVAVWVCDPRGLGSIWSAGPFDRPGTQTAPRQLLDGGTEVVDFDREVTEPVADVYDSVCRPVHQFERDQLIVGELEHGQSGAIGDVHATDLFIPDCRVELQ